MASNLEQEMEQLKKSLKHQKDSRQGERERRKVTIKQLKQRSKEENWSKFDISHFNGS